MQEKENSNLLEIFSVLNRKRHQSKSLKVQEKSFEAMIVFSIF
jgi:hypothetical protein